MTNFKLLFSDYFKIDQSVVNNYGALNICLAADMPLFIDPFLLFASDDEEYQKLHRSLINHILILKEIAIKDEENAVNNGIFRFPEIKQNWLGLSKFGNSGRGLGKDFAKKIIRSFNGFYNSFGEEQISAETHIEKLTILNPGIGSDFISDFTTNLILDYLLEYTQTFALKNLSKDQIREFSINSVFDEKFNRWMPKKYTLPYLYLEDRGDFIILTPLDILTKDEAAINNSEFYSNFLSVANSIKNMDLRNSINTYFRSQLPKKPTVKDKTAAVNKTVIKFPEIIDYYIKSKEDNKENVSKLTKERIENLTSEFIIALTSLGDALIKKSDFYKILPTTTYEESLKRVHFLKDVIENNDVYKTFYKDGIAIAKEEVIQRIFRLTWYATPFDVNSEVNNGRGPADYKVSYGADDSTIVEFKLGKSSSLTRNLQFQTDIYKKASKSTNDIKVILCYTVGEIKNVEKTLQKLQLLNQENIIIIDASPKKSASVVK
ncbi:MULTISPECIES: hypothetical protein [unclassified Kaistella]|uniref:hypothetical protein n=1 Tax=unclassified Kaistella TaxID=2762626 RepID=UPI0027353C25|nr:MULTISPECIES: hypothetical protein [unclassified Kaistella]MDP2453249.1 hypothetical protein [Kaistella sp. SH11-4b]MDP2456306.1 hypothetical protein [Kaistella sp. SH40-3]MDP2459062.1 hypothetical protein [Kaistella sp. SH19-2b]